MVWWCDADVISSRKQHRYFEDVSGQFSVLVFVICASHGVQRIKSLYQSDWGCWSFGIHTLTWGFATVQIFRESWEASFTTQKKNRACTWLWHLCARCITCSCQTMPVFLASCNVSFSTVAIYKGQIWTSGDLCVYGNSGFLERNMHLTGESCVNTRGLLFHHGWLDVFGEVTGGGTGGQNVAAKKIPFMDSP